MGKKTERASAEPCRLKVSRAEAEEKVAQQLAVAQQLRGRDFRSPGDVQQVSDDAQTWVDVTTHLLKTLFSTDEEADKYANRVRMSFTMNPSADELLSEQLEDIQERARRLDSLLKRLHLFEDPVMPSAKAMPPAEELPDLLGRLIIGDKGLGTFRGSVAAPFFLKAGWQVTRPCPTPGWESWAAEQIRLFRAKDERAAEKILLAMASPEEFLDSLSRVKDQLRAEMIYKWNGLLAPYGLRIAATATDAAVEVVVPGYLSASATVPPLVSPARTAAPRKPRVFIGSSTEGLKIAEAAQVELDYDAECTLWKQDVFRLSKGNLENLVDESKKYDFAILVLTPDDMVTKRGEEVQAPRDNVLFELGLFMGALGRNRVFMLHRRDADLELPSDLAGIATATFQQQRGDGNLQAALGAPCTIIKNEMSRVGLRANLNS